MLDEGDKEKIDAQFSLLDARSRKRRRSSILMTIVLVVVTGTLVLQLARDIVNKQAQVQSVEKSRGELDQRLQSEQEKLDTATRARQKLESEIKELEAIKKSYQDRILSDKDVHNFGEGQREISGKIPFVDDPHIETNLTGAPNDVPIGPPVAQESEALIIEEEGKTPQGLYIRPDVTVAPALGLSGRQIYKVQLSLDLPADQRGDVERVTYHLSPKHYLKNEIEGGSAPNFEAKFNVFACESTVLARVRLRSGTTLAVDFDWCRYSGWPTRKKEPVIVTSDVEKTPINVPITTAPQPKPPGRTPPTATAAPPTAPREFR